MSKKHGAAAVRISHFLHLSSFIYYLVESKRDFELYGRMKSLIAMLRLLLFAHL